MIVSHKHKFIFLKTKKTAGTSIEISLSRYCGPNDIITPIAPEDEKIRAGLGIKPQNYIVPFDGTAKNKRNEDGNIVFSNHNKAKSIREILGQDVWNSYYKFSFDRSPWDKVISYYYFRMAKSNKTIDFEQFLEKKKFKGCYNYPIYTIDDKLAVDFLGKYENLDQDLTAVCEHLGLAYDGWLPNAKGNYREKNKRNYRNMYNNEQQKLIENFFKKEIDILGYEF
ncbi:sulfotransferase family 2 domain-containing protein [Peribacillus sp. SCS-155]|uniref:sulfotransferase family 2 domain-containing protein n=1 Tax=Peribacillus sedimenti TaxID=3115297 RepID=UPI0039058DAD